MNQIIQQVTEISISASNLTVRLCLPCWGKQALHAYLAEREKSTSDSPVSGLEQRTVGEEFWNVKVGGMAYYGYPILLKG